MNYYNIIGVWCNGSTTDFGSVCVGSNPTTPTIYIRIYNSNMSKGKKYNTPKRFWHKMPHKKSWRAHVMSSDHKKFKWFFRKKKWFTDELLKRMSMRFPMSHEIWGWD